MRGFNEGNPANKYIPNSSSKKLGFFQFIKRFYRLNFKKYSNCKISNEKWDSQYESGYWDYLSNIKELSHYSLIAGYSNYFSPNGNILDIGCGNGVLQQLLKKFNYNYYTGVDISIEAITIAKKYTDNNTEFICSSVDSFTPTRNYDVIIFNECLYYLQDPIYIINNLKRFLNSNGKIIISMFGDDEAVVHCWNLIDKLNSEVDSVMVTHKSGTYWIIKVLNNS